jgi:hypothetical protein
MRFPSFPAVLLPAALSLAHVTSPALVPGDGLRPDTPADYAPHPDPGRTHNEFWTWQFRFTNGTQAQLNISRAHFGSFKSPVSGADLSVMNFGGGNHFVAREYPSSNFEWDPASERLAVHANIFAEGVPPRAHRVQFATRKDGTSYFLDLEFSDMIQGVVRGDGELRLRDGNRAGVYIHVPGARVQGRIGIDGDTLDVEGFGWMDHTWQTNFATRIMDAGYRYAVTEGRREGGVFFENGKTLSGYGVREENGRLVLLDPSGMTVRSRGSWGGHSLPERFDIELERGEPVRFQRTENLQRNAFLQELNRLERFGARMFLGGEIFGFRGAGTVDKKYPALWSFTLVR